VGPRKLFQDLGILLSEIMQFFFCVGKRYDCNGILSLEFVQCLVSFLDLLIQSLILNFQLLKIDQMQSISKFFFLFINLLILVELISEF
jgi:hypothetical protein